MRFRILGPLSVEVAGAPLRIRSARVSTLLATLLLEANRTVPADRLIEAVWGWHAPPTARAQLTIVVSQLRRLLAQAGAPRPVVVTETAGYRLAASTGEVDSLMFEQRVADAERAVSAGRSAEAVGRFRSALDLWHGPALAGVDGQLVQTAATLLAERRAAVRARRIELELALGRHSDLVTELIELIGTDPFNERIRTYLVIALYRSGRVTEALATYQDFRQRLADEIGIEPSRRLAALHHQILNRDPVLDPPTEANPVPGPPAGTGLVLGPTAEIDPTFDPPAGTRPLLDPTAEIDPAQSADSTGAADPLPAGPPDGGTEPDRPGRRSGDRPAHRRATHRRAGGRRGLRLGGTPGRRPNGQPGGPARRRPSGRDGTTTAQPAESPGEPGEPGRATRPDTERPLAGPSLVEPSRAEPFLAGPPLPVTPRQLPPAVADFVGRDAELARIRRALDGGTDRSGPAVVVVSGLPGVGKTALAIRAGWAVDGRHPDGCLYAELIDDQGVPVDPHEVLGAFLPALGVPEGSIPAGRTERRALYRSVVARRRLLVLLDGADEEAQVRPLLPTGPASAALVTAGRPLTGLDGAHLITLDLLPVEPAVRLLTGMLPDRMAGDLPAARRVVQLCDRLPLAIRVTGSRLAVRADPSLGQSAERLADASHRLDRLAEGERDVRRGLATAYQRLDPYPAALLRRLGALPVADFPGWLAVPLLDADRGTAQRALTELVDAGLVYPEPVRAGGVPRYRMPELVRLYARERVGVDDPPPLRATAYRRAYWWLLDLALRADGQLPGQLFPTGVLGSPEGFGPPAELLRSVDDDPLGWLTIERDLVVGAAEQAAGLGDAELAWRLAVAPTNFFHRRGLTQLWQRAVDHGRTALRGRSDAVRAQAVLSFSHALLLLSRAEATAAWTTARTARRLFDQLDDRHRAAACATVQWLATHRSGPPYPGTSRSGAWRTADGTAPRGAPIPLRSVIRRIGAAPRATPILCPADQPEPLPQWAVGDIPPPRRRSVQRTPEGVPLAAGQVGKPGSVSPSDHGGVHVGEFVDRRS